MGNDASKMKTSEEMVNFQKLDRHFSAAVVGKWLKNDLIDSEAYFVDLMGHYGKGSMVHITNECSKDEKYKVHLREMLDYHMNWLLNKPVKNGLQHGFLIPKISGKSDILNMSHISYLQMHLIESCRHHWKVIYNSRVNGESWSQFLNPLLTCPSRTLIIINSGKRTFGAFMSEPWQSNPGVFVGTSDNFLFHLKDEDSETLAYKSTFYNDNYAYLSIHAASCINGMGFGGQVDFFGLYLNENFIGNSFAKPLSSTYGSPQLTEQESFKIDHLEAISVEEFDPEDYKIKHPNFTPFGKQETLEFLELAGIQTHSNAIPPPVEPFEKE